MLDHFGLLAPFYDRLIGPPDPEQWTTLLRLPTAGPVLDAGGGTGRVSARLASLTGRLVISDLSRPMLKQAQDKGPLQAAQNQVERLPFADAVFERVLVVDALHHFRDQARAIAELLRVLKPGGRLVIEEPDIDHFAVKLIALAEKIAFMGSHFYSATEIGQMAAAQGLPAQIEYDPARYAAWVIVDK